VVALRDDVAAAWGLDLTVARPDVDLAAYPLAQDKVACCRDLKVAPLGRAIREQGVDLVLSGVRADEHPSRAQRPSCEARHDPDHVLAHPVLHFTEMDVWAYIMDRGLPYCTLYADGYRSLGCVPCTARADAAAPERAGRDAEKERNLEVLHSLGYF
jgi:phosphoadenosine phosphosulfate reductase